VKTTNDTDMEAILQNYNDNVVGWFQNACAQQLAKKLADSGFKLNTLARN